MADFRRYIPTLQKWEGGWSDKKEDKGGATMKGVTLATFQAYYGAHRTKEDLRKITDEQWEFIMKIYWNRCKADQIRNQSIAEIFVDWHINAGVNAIKQVQKAFMLDADGIVGPKTLSVLNSPDAERVFTRIKIARESYYRNVCLCNPSQGKFLAGWLNRTNSFVFNNY